MVSGMDAMLVLSPEHMARYRDAGWSKERFRTELDELLLTLNEDLGVTIVIVTHNMAQARRASEECIFMLMGKVIEHTETGEMFLTPKHKETTDYIEGRYG